MSTTKVEIVIPFGGFYNTIWSRGIDSEEDQFVENWLEENNDDGLLDEDEVRNMVFMQADYSAMFEVVAKKYVDLYADWLSEELGFPVEMEFTEMVSPREYNFTTDRIFAKIDLEVAKRIFAVVDRDTLSTVCEDHLRSRSGFISFYDYQWCNWGEVEDWDCNQLSMLLYAVQHDEEDLDLNLYYDTEFGPAFDAGFDFDAFEEKVRVQRLTASGECEDDGRSFPTHINDTKHYVAAYEAANHLRSDK